MIFANGLGMTPTEQITHDALKKAWEFAPAGPGKDAARAALVAYDASLAPPPPPPVPVKVSSTTDFLSEHATGIILGLVIAGGAGYLLMRYRS
jgi:hypothetical protein